MISRYSTMIENIVSIIHCSHAKGLKWKKSQEKVEVTEIWSKKEFYQQA